MPDTNSKPISFEEIEAIEGMPSIWNTERFADLVNKYRPDSSRSDKHPLLDDEDVKFLIDLAFYASVTAEEGRYPRFRLINYQYNAESDEYRTMVEFGEEIRLENVDDIHRLLPAVSSLNYALRVIKKESGFFCNGIVLVDDAEFWTDVGETSFENFFGLEGFSIRVEGPGDIIVTQSGTNAQTFRLSAGRAETMVQLDRCEDFKKWLKWVSEKFVDIYLIDEATKSNNRGFKSSAASDIKSIIEFYIGSLLQKISEGRHGGSFVIIPEKINADAMEEKYNIKLKYKINNLNIGKIITDYWKSGKNIHTLEVTNGVPVNEWYKDFDPRIWKQKRHFLQSSIQAIANLANVDGCVVIDEELNVLGFGGKISKPEAEFKTMSDIERSSVHNRPSPITEQDLKGYGLRHLNAARLCQAHAGTLAFIISQDGGLRLFTSVESVLSVMTNEIVFVYFYKQVAALKRGLESF